MMHVEIWSDVVCPWCYIGKRNFERALAEFEERDEVHVTWRSFELNPDLPAEADLGSMMAARSGGTREGAFERLREMEQRMAGVGIESHLHRARLGNTRDAHRLLHLAERHGIQAELKERLLKAFFTDGEPIGLADALQRVALDAGLPADEVADVLSSDRFGEEVEQDVQLARAIGIRGVPFFAVDRSYGASGAQPPEALLALLQKAKAETAAVAPSPDAGDG
jgi:predicted DsbA family dithiol-disulfide isomerase